MGNINFGVMLIITLAFIVLGVNRNNKRELSTIYRVELINPAIEGK